MSNEDSKDNACFEIEMAVVGSLFIWFQELRSRIPTMSEDDFLYKETREIFKMLRDAPPDANLALLVSLTSGENKVTLLDSKEYAVGAHVFEGHLRRLLELSQSRRIHDAVTELAFGRDISVRDLQDIIDREMPRSNLFLWAEKAEANFDRFIQSLDNPKERITTGFYDIDKIVGGFRIPAVSIIGALPGTGKTAFALNIARNQDRPVVFFSLEMSAEMIYERFASDMLSIEYSLFSTQKLSASQKQKIKECKSELKKQIAVYDDIYDIESQGMAINSMKPALVVVDYIQKVHTSKRCQDRRNEIEYISGQYKQIANYNNCHIMLLSQLNRDKNRKKPSMSDLKESGALEADGDYVMLLHRPYVLDKKGNKAEASLVMDKNKFGGTGRIDLAFIGEYQRFTLCYRDEEGNGADLPF